MSKGLAFSLEDVCRLGKRIVLFPNKGVQVYFINGKYAERYVDVFQEGKKVPTVFERLPLEKIYPTIQRVYDRKTKGVLIARRAHPATQLRSTGKGMGKKIQRETEMSREQHSLVESQQVL
ncbi:hypothetical protein [Enterococcus rivorum]|uniref:Uncharacterized protein n=1 Tax=Enterococcus rivorum TaxID=762845 RepID=A0A1E5L0G9_9ENTE|nr:hypothetical protein [Enterococcus rivorum]MBP2098895.1 hypothetical protein [Enterococcus rivorum]OEH83620.1 hypothetical protein BCR26_09085 [Enterococcus rivorum]